MRHPHPLLETYKKRANEFRAGVLSLEDIQHTLSAIMSALEGDIPTTIREAFFDSEARIDSIRFTINESDRKKEVLRVLTDLDKTIRDQTNSG